MRAIFLFLALTLPSLLLAAPSKTLRCVTTHYPPFTIFDEKSDTFTGLDIDSMITSQKYDKRYNKV